MNIIEYSIRLGKSLNKLTSGKDLKSIYNQVRERYKSIDIEQKENFYSVYNQCAEKECARYHFFGWFVAYEKMKSYVENKDEESNDLMLAASEYVIQNEDILQLALEAQKMGQLVVKIADAVIKSNYDDEDICKILKNIKVKNAVTDLQMAVERSGLKMFMIKNSKHLLDAKSRYDEYEEELNKNNYIPYLGEKRPAIALENVDDVYIDMIDRLLFIQHIILMGVFEGFWNILINLDESEGVEGKICQVSKIKSCSFSHNSTEKELQNSESWMYKIYIGEEYVYVLAKERTIRFDKGNLSTEVLGICYPKEDFGLFEEEKVTC